MKRGFGALPPPEFEWQMGKTAATIADAKRRSLMTLCSECKNFGRTMVARVCKRCGKTSDRDRSTLRYCATCATKLGICRGCGKKLNPRAKTVTLNLRLKNKTSFPAKLVLVAYLYHIPGVIKVEQVFPDEDDPRLAALYLVKVEASKVDAVMAALKTDPDVKSVQISPLYKAQKRKK